MMRHYQGNYQRRYSINGVGLLLLLLLFSNYGRAQAESPNPIAILETTATTMTIELRVDDFTWAAEPDGAASFYRIEIPGLPQRIEPGRPTVPVASTMLGLPTTAGLTVTIIDSADETYHGYQLNTAPALTALVDPAPPLHASNWLTASVSDDVPPIVDEYWPTQVVEFGELGYLRDQPVAQIRFSPVQYNAAQQTVRIYRRLTVRLTWDAAAAEVQAANVSPVFEALLQTTLLNYKLLTRPPLATHTGEPQAAPAMDSAPSLPTTLAAAYKIGIDAAGIYRLTIHDLRAVGLDPARIDPRKLHLTHSGNPMPIHIVGEADGRFDEDDFILFYAAAVQSPYTKTDIYWLTLGDTPGRRMALQEGRPTETTAAPVSFPAQLHAEEDTAYWQALRSTADRWFWGTRLAPNTQGLARERTYTVSLHEIAAGDELATVSVHLQGYTALSHRTQIYLNGTLIDEQSWRGQLPFTHRVQVAHSLLRTADNHIRVTTVDTGETVDQILVNWVEIAYQARYTAPDNELWFGPAYAGRHEFAIHGFTRNDIFVWNISDLSNPMLIANAAVIRADRQFSLRFADNATATSRYYAFSPDDFRRPRFFVADYASNWQSAQHGADYILITAEQFYASAAQLADQRRAAGLRVAVVGIQDIYDEFSGGRFDPRAIRDFLAYAYTHWQRPAPLYVLLLGDANQDYKDNLGNDTPNYVPSRNMNSSLSGEISTDDWFAQVNGNDQLPDLLIGRLVAQSEAEANAIVAKIIAYETAPPDQQWNRQVLLVADDADSRYQEFSERLAAQLPFDYTKNRVYNLSGDPQGQIIHQLNAGQVLVNYIGHGEFFGWGIGGSNNGSIFHKDDVAGLQNQGRLPLITVGNCLNGFFAGPKTASTLAEVLQRTPERGAVAIWAPSGLGAPTGHAILLEHFYAAIFQHDQLTVGAATTAAKLATLTQNPFWADLTQSYILFGDPATRLGVPPTAPYLIAVEPADQTTATPLDQPLTATFQKPMDPTTVVLQVVNGPALDFTPHWNDTRTAVSFLHPKFINGRHYTVAINGQDTAGRQLRDGLLAKTWSFQATTDGIAPMATIALQGGAANGVITTGSLILTFDEPVRPSSIQYSISPWVPGNLQWSADGQQAIFQHSRFTEGQTYVFTLETALDHAGNSLAQPVQRSFTVIKTFYHYLPFVKQATANPSVR